MQKSKAALMLHVPVGAADSQLDSTQYSEPVFMGMNMSVKLSTRTFHSNWKSDGYAEG